MQLASRLGSFIAQLATGRTHGVSIRYYGPLVSARAEMLASAVVAGVLQPLLSSAVTIVNARAVAVQRGIESSRPAARGRELHQPAIGQAANERRRTVGRRHGIRTGQSTAVVGRRRRGRSAARRHAHCHHEQRSTGCDRRGRHHSRTSRLNIANFALGRSAAGRWAWSRSMSPRRRVRCGARSTRSNRRTPFELWR